MTLAEDVTQLKTKLDTLTAKITAIESDQTALKESTKEVRRVKQIVIEKEDSLIKVRALINVIRLNQTETQWADATEQFTQEELKEIIQKVK